MHANVVVNRMPYVIAPSPFSLTSLFLSVTSWRKLENDSEKIPVELGLVLIESAAFKCKNLITWYIGEHTDEGGRYAQ